MIEYNIPTFLNSYDKIQVKDKYVKLESRFYGFEKVRIDSIEKVRLKKGSITNFDKFPLIAFSLYEIIFLVLLFGFDLTAIPVPSYVFYILSGVCALGLILLGIVNYKYANVTIETVGSDVTFKAEKEQAKKIADKF